ncbi:MAG: uncharacterized protein JWP40_382 [Blastococcus sp.]|nr:uncharacterized protein [Blastococcus sp.]
MASRFTGSAVIGSAVIDSRAWPCPTCGDMRMFVQPPCTDGHTDDGGECPEWACADCGAAFVIGDVSVVSDILRMRLAA